MNERIRELIEQTGATRSYMMYVSKDHPEQYRVDEHVKIMEKFAEFLIKECAGICDQQGRVGWNDDRKAQARLDRDLIKEHFGVK